VEVADGRKGWTPERAAAWGLALPRGLADRDRARIDAGKLRQLVRALEQNLGMFGFGPGDEGLFGGWGPRTCAKVRSLHGLARDRLSCEPLSGHDRFANAHVRGPSRQIDPRRRPKTKHA